MRTYSTRQVAEQMGFTFAYFRALIARPECPTPTNRVAHSLVWTDDDIARLKAWLDARPKRGRPRSGDKQKQKPRKKSKPDSA